MDKKKLIGTIIGVTLFAALIAGATFAWLTFAVGVENGTYDAGTMEFKIDYVGGAGIDGEIPILGTATRSTAASNEIKAYRTAKSPDGTLTISLTTTTTDNVLTTKGVIKYAVCKSDGTTTDLSKVDKTGGVLAVGTVSTGTQVLYKTDDTEDPADDEIEQLGANETVANKSANYIIYFWLDGSILDSDMIGESYSGYIHASAEQDNI